MLHRFQIDLLTEPFSRVVSNPKYSQRRDESDFMTLSKIVIILFMRAITILNVA